MRESILNAFALAVSLFLTGGERPLRKQKEILKMLIAITVVCGIAIGGVLGALMKFLKDVREHDRELANEDRKRNEMVRMMVRPNDDDHPLDW